MRGASEWLTARRLTAWNLVNVTRFAPADQPVIHRAGVCEFDPVSSGRVPLCGHPVSTGAACPRTGLLAPAVGGRCQPKGQPATPGVDIVESFLTWHRRTSREQAYVPAEQPSSPQGARFPPAHAHPCGPRDSVLAPPQGSQEPGRLTHRRTDRRAGAGPSAHLE